jgi:hypothetical protein
MLRNPLYLTVSFAILGSLSQAAEFVWLEAERFPERGGWTNDSQFIDQMGSPYLLANGLGTPVRDAITRVTLPLAGRWRLWVRARDWVPEHHPGRFQVLINGQSARATFGASGQAGWRWENGGERDLSGMIELRLHDLTGYYGRCDVLVLTTDPNWTPPEDREAIADLRERWGGVSRDIQPAGDYDVVVVGGGLAGCIAAVTAARLGTRTVLIQNRPVLGGNGSTEILVPPVGFWPHGKLDPRAPRESGLIEEAGLAGRQQLRDTRYWSSRLLRLVAAEPNLDLHLNTHVTGVQTRRLGLRPDPVGTESQPTAIAAVLAVDVENGARRRFGGQIVIDCTGDGAVGVAAGAEYRVGREPRSLYDESLAPETGNATTMGNSLKYCSLPTGSPQPFDTPVWARAFPDCESFPAHRHPPHVGPDLDWQWMLELGGIRDTYRDKEEIRDDLLRLIYGIWGHVKNDCPKLQKQAAEHKLVWVGHVAGMRESRRLIGDYVFTENDVAQQTLFPDRVAFGGWGLDDHYSEGFFYQGPPSRHPYQGRLHSVPYRSLYSKNVANLLFAGRDISTSHAGMGTTRVMMTCAVIGQAAGTAAALCVEHATTPRGVYQEHLEQLQQQLLKDGAYLVRLPNRDPRDLARRAAVTASSETVDANGERLAATNVIDGIARLEDGHAHAWLAEKGRPGPHWLELAWTEPQTFNVVHVTFFTQKLAPRRLTLEVSRGTDWQPLASVDQQLRRHVVGLERTTAAKLRLVLPQPAGVCEVRVYDEPQRVVEIARRAARNRSLPDLNARFPWETADAPPVEMVRGLPLTDAVNKYGGTLLDDTQAEATGDWVESTYSTPFLGDSYLHDGNRDQGEKSLCFRPHVDRAGTYELRLAYTALNNRASNTLVTIRTAAGEQTVRVDQRRAPEIDGLFHSLGRFSLDAGEGTCVTISNLGADGYVVVDALHVLP